MIPIHEQNGASAPNGAHERIENAVKSLLASFRCSQDPEIRRSADAWIERLFRDQEQKEAE